jgi:hypothetical protein
MIQPGVLWDVAGGGGILSARDSFRSDFGLEGVKIMAVDTVSGNLVTSVNYVSVSYL